MAALAVPLAVNKLGLLKDSIHFVSQQVRLLDLSLPLLVIALAAAHLLDLDLLDRLIVGVQLGRGLQVAAEGGHLGVQVHLGQHHLPSVVLAVQDAPLLELGQAFEPVHQERELLLVALLHPFHDK
jgi:hypothetical protein